MKKQLGIFAALLAMCVTALSAAGYSYCSQGDCSSPQYSASCSRAGKCHYPSSSKLCCADGITVYATNPEQCTLGDEYPLEFAIEACDDVCDVEVSTILPEGVTYISSNPEARVEGKKLVWEIPMMSKGEVICARVFLRCDAEGELCACFCAHAKLIRFCSLLCAKPILVCCKQGPEEVCYGDPVNYTITVSNVGTCPAQDVVVTDNVPFGLEHKSGLTTLCYRLGDLCPGECKTINICLTACTRGQVCNTVNVSSANSDSVSCEWCTNVIAWGCEIVKTGPKMVSIGQNADYEIVVTNTGDKSITGIVITDCVPVGTSVVSAPGATVNQNQVVWRLRELRAGERISFNLTLTTCTPGSYTNRVALDSCEGLTCCADFTTRWRGRPALNVCLCDTDDPICVGDPVSYIITVTNQGSEFDHNVSVVVKFPKEIAPIAGCGESPGAVSGSTVTFQPIDVLPL